MFRRDIANIFFKNHPNQTSKDKNVWDKKYTGIKNWWDIAEEKISDFGDLAMETIQNETESEGLEDREQSISELWGNSKQPIHIQPQPPKKREMRRQNKIFEEIMVKTFPNLIKTINSPIQEAQQIPFKSEELGTKKGSSWVLDSHPPKIPVIMKSTCGWEFFCPS